MTLKTRLVKLEQRQRQQGEANDPNRPPSLAELFGYPRGTPLAKMLQDNADRIAREVADGTYVPIPPPPDDVWPENVINVDSELCKITGDLDGWRENEKKIKRWSPEWEQVNWPNGAPAKECP